MTPLLLNYRPLIALLICGLLCIGLQGATTTWDGDTDTNWVTTGNWDTGSKPVNGDAVVFTGTAGDYSLSLATDEVMDSITFNSTATTPYTITGAGTIEIDNGNEPGFTLDAAAADVTIGTGFKLGAGSVNFNIGESRLLTLNGVLQEDGGGARGFDMQEKGTLLLNAASTFTGDADIQQGVLKFGINNAIGSTATQLDVESDGTVDFAGFDSDADMQFGGNGNWDVLGGIINSNTASTSTLSGNIEFVSDSEFGGNGDIIVTGNLNQDTDNRSFRLRGDGTVTFQGTNNMTANQDENHRIFRGKAIFDYTTNNTEKLGDPTDYELIAGASDVEFLGSNAAATSQSMRQFKTDLGHVDLLVTSGTNQDITVNLNTLTNTGGNSSLDVKTVDTGTGNAIVTTDTLNDATSGIIDGQFTWNGGSSWLVNTSGTVDGTLGGYSAFTNISAASTGTDKNIDVDADYTFSGNGT